MSDSKTEAVQISDVQLLHLWDTHVAYETGAYSSKMLPLRGDDKLNYARAVIAAATSKSQERIRELEEALRDILRENILCPEGGAETVAEIHCIARAALKE